MGLAPVVLETLASIDTLLVERSAELRRVRSLIHDFCATAGLRTILVWGPCNLLTRSWNVTVVS